MSRYPEFTLAAVQAAPVLFDAEASRSQKPGHPSGRNLYRWAVIDP